MAISGTIGQGTIRIVIDGWAAASKQMTALRVQGQLAISAANNAGKASSKASDDAAKSAAKATTAWGSFNKSVLAMSGIFAVASVGIRSFAAAADPRGALELELAFVRLQVAIGRFFIPIIREAATAINQLAKWINGLSNDTRENASHWTKLGLAVTGGAAALGVIIGIFGRVGAVLLPLVRILPVIATWFWRILGFLGPWGRAIVIVGSLVAAFIALNNAGGEAEGTFGRIAKAAMKAWEIIKTAWGKLVVLVTPVVDALGRLWDKFSDRLGQTFDKIADKVGPLLERLGDNLAKLFDVDSGKLEAFFNKVAAGIDAVIPLVDKLFDAIDAVDLSGMWAGWLASAQPALNFFQALGGLGQSALEGIGKQLDKLQPHFERFGALARDLFGFIAEQSKRVTDALEGIASRLAPPLIQLFGTLQQLFGKIYELFTAVVNFLSRNLGPVLDWLGDKIGVVFKWLGDAFATILVPAKKVIGLFADLFIWLGHRVESAFTAVINFITSVLNKAIAAINKVIDKINSVNPGKDIDKVEDVQIDVDKSGIEQARKDIEDFKKADWGKVESTPLPPKPVTEQPKPEIDNKLVAKAAEEKKQTDAKLGNKFQGQLLGNASVIGIADAMRKAQESTVPSKESVLIQELTQKVGQGNNTLEAIKDNTAVKPNMGLAK